MPLFKTKKSIARQAAHARAVRRRLDLLDTARILAVESRLSFVTEPDNGAVMITTPDRLTRILVDPIVTPEGMVPRISVVKDEDYADVPFNMSTIGIMQMSELSPEEMLVHVVRAHAPAEAA